MTSITKRTVTKGEYIPLWKFTQARKRHRNFDWNGWEEARMRLRRNYENEEDQMKDEALKEQGMALVKAESIDYGMREITHDAQREEMLKVVKGLYSKEEMDEGTLQGIVEIAKGNNINPAAPNSIFAFKQKVKQKDGTYKEEWVIGLGYQSWISIARQKVQFFYKPPRYMTEEEKKTYKVGDKDLGVIIEFFRREDMQQAAEMRAMGLDDVDWRDFAIHGIGKWRAVAYSYYDKNAKKSVDVPDSIPNTWDEFQVAAKRAVVNGCRKLGIVLANDVPGATLTDEGDYRITSGITESAPSLPSTIEPTAIEGEIQDDEQAESTGDIQAIEPDVQPDEDHDTAPETANDPEPEKTENAGSVAKDTAELFDRIGRRAVLHRKHKGGKDTISESEAQQKTRDYEDLFTLALEKEDDATTYCKAFLNAVFSITAFKSIQVAQLKALEDWSAANRTADAHAEIQMFKKFHDAAMDAEKAKANGDEPE